MRNIVYVYLCTEKKCWKKVPAIFYNPKGYDGHSVIQARGKFNIEKYFLICMGNRIIFINSLQLPKKAGIH